MERQIITVDIAPGNSQVERLGSSQGDIGRPMGVYIIQNGVALDCSAYSAELYILKPDGKFYTTQATVDTTKTNLIKWETALQETPVAGACAAQIRITAGDDDIGTARFVEFVEASPCNMGSASESEVALLTEYVRQARESATSAGRDATTASGAASSASGSASTATTAANTATQAASAAIAAANRAEAVEESIPEDYSQMSADVTELKSAFERLDANVITESAGPSPTVSIADGADGMPMRSVEVAIEPVQEGEGDPAPDNVRPISGWNGVKVTKTGKNLFDKNLSRTVNKLRDDNGVQQTTSSSSYTEDFGGVEPGTTYTLSGSISKNTGSGRIYYLDKYHNWISRSNGITQERMPYTITTPANCKYLAVQYLNSASDLDDLQLELGSVATDYEPFGQTYDITFPADPGTVYGGTLDVASGKLVVNRAILETTWGAGGSATEYDDRTRKRWNLNPAQDPTQGASAVCNLATYQAQPAPEINRFSFHATQAYLYLSLAKDTDSSTPIQVCYRIASPQEFTLSQTEIKTLLGLNNVFSDCGDTAITYPADTKLYIDNRINSTRRLIAGIETGFTASKLYAVGDMLIIGDYLYKVTAQIASGATITVGTNVTKTTVAEQLLALANA